MSQHNAFHRCSTCVLCTCMSLCVEMTQLSVSGWKYNTGDMLQRGKTGHHTLIWHLQFYFSPLLTQPSPHFMASEFWGTWRLNHNQCLATSFDEHVLHNGQWHRVTHMRQLAALVPSWQPRLSCRLIYRLNEQVQYGMGLKQELELQKCKLQSAHDTPSPQPG